MPMNGVDTVPTASPAVRYSRWAGLLIGAVATRIVGQAWDAEADIGVLYAIVAFGLCAIMGVLAGDALTARPRGPVRTAGLAPRQVRDYVPPRMTPFLIAQAGVVVVLVVAAAILARSDEASRAGHPLAFACQDGSVIGIRSWPGVHNGLPILTCLAVSTAACLWSLTWIARRPGDDQTRHDSALTVVAAWGLLVSALLLGIASTVSGDLMSTTCDGTLVRIGAALLWPTALVALVTVSWCLFTVISPKARVRR